MIQIYKNKGDAQSYKYYVGIKLICHTMKLRDRVLEAMLYSIKTITESQFDSMHGSSIIRAITILDILWRNIEKEIWISIWCSSA